MKILIQNEFQSLITKLSITVDDWKPATCTHLGTFFHSQKQGSRKSLPSETRSIGVESLPGILELRVSGRQQSPDDKSSY